MVDYLSPLSLLIVHSPSLNHFLGELSANTFCSPRFHRSAHKSVCLLLVMHSQWEGEGEERRAGEGKGSEGEGEKGRRKEGREG